MGSTQSVRPNGAKKFLVGVAGAVLMGFGLNWIQLQGFAPTGYGLIILGIPGAYGIVGLLELATGSPFSEMSDWWDNLRGWQQGILGVLVVVLAFCAMIGGVALVFGDFS